MPDSEAPSHQTATKTPMQLLSLPATMTPIPPETVPPEKQTDTNLIPSPQEQGDPSPINVVDTTTPTSPHMYESPSPASSDSAHDFEFSTPAPRHNHSRSETTVVQLTSDPARPLSPIHPNQSLWPTSHFVPLIEGESTPLTRSHESRQAELAETHLRPHLERARLVSRESLRYREDTLRDRYILGCSILVVTSIVFVILVSGMTTMLADSNFPQLQILSDWTNGDVIPLKYGCHADNGVAISFPLRWRNVPRSATNLVILFANAGAMLTAENDPVHWLVTDIPLNSGSSYFLPANASANPELLPPGAEQHANRYSKEGAYWPPCAADNGTSLFVIHAYAIEASPIIDHFRDAREVMNRFVGVPFAKLTGVYGQPVPQTKRHVAGLNYERKIANNP